MPVVRPATRKQRHDKMFLPDIHRRHIAIPGIPGESRFPGEHAIHAVEQRILIIYRKLPCTITACECILPCLADCLKRFFLFRLRNAIPHELCQLTGSRMVYTACILGV